MTNPDWTEALVRALHPELLSLWEAAIAQGRAEGIEAGAKVADELADGYGDAWHAEKDEINRHRLDERHNAVRQTAAAIRALSQGSGSNEGGVTQADRGDKLTPAFCAASPLQKWELLTLNGLLGTDEPWIDNMRDALREQEAALQASLSRQPAPPASEVGALCERLRGLLAKATKGPWRHVQTKWGPHIQAGPEETRAKASGSGTAYIAEGGVDGEVRTHREEEDIALIVEAVNALPTLLESLSRNGEVR